MPSCVFLLKRFDFSLLDRREFEWIRVEIVFLCKQNKLLIFCIISPTTNFACFVAGMS